MDSIRSVINPQKPILKNIAANLLEFCGTGLQIGSEIVIVIGGMGYFFTPPLKKVYDELLGKNIHYSVVGSGTITASYNNSMPIPEEQGILVHPQSTSTLQIEDAELLYNNVTFDLAFPQIINTSELLASVGIVGLTCATLFKMYAVSLHGTPNTPDISEQDLRPAQIKFYLCSLLYWLLLISSRCTAVYATCTISLTRTLANVPKILTNFDLSSKKEFDLDQIDLDTYPEIAKRIMINSVHIYSKFSTNVDFSELRVAAEKGNEKIESSDYRAALAMAVFALFLGFAALKFYQKKSYYKRTIKNYEATRDSLTKKQQQYEKAQFDTKEENEIENPLTQQLVTKKIRVHTQSIFSNNKNCITEKEYAQPHDDIELGKIESDENQESNGNTFVV